jgi:hypothetical protein
MASAVKRTLISRRQRRKTVFQNTALQVLEKISACELRLRLRFASSQSSHLVYNYMQPTIPHYTFETFPKKKKKKECVHRVMRTFPYNIDILTFTIQA